MKVFESGQWKDVKTPKVFIGGSWESARKGMVFKEGQWVTFFLAGDLNILPEPRGKLGFKLSNVAINKSTNFNGNPDYHLGETHGSFLPVTESKNIKEFTLSSQLWDPNLPSGVLYVDGASMHTKHDIGQSEADVEYTAISEAFNTDPEAKIILMNDSTHATYEILHSNGFAVEDDSGHSGPRNAWAVRRSSKTDLFNFMKSAYDNNQTISIVGVSGQDTSGHVALVPSGELGFKQDILVEEGGFAPGNHWYMAPNTSSISTDAPVTDSTNIAGAQLVSYTAVGSNMYTYTIYLETKLHAGRRSTDPETKAAKAQADKVVNAFNSGGKIVIEFKDGTQYSASSDSGWVAKVYRYTRNGPYEIHIQLEDTPDSTIDAAMKRASGNKENVVFVGMS